MSEILTELETLIADRKANAPADSYVAKMLNGPAEDLYRKIPEEATEVILACTHNGKITEELADLWFMSLLVMAKHDIKLAEVLEVLSNRRKSKQ